jgi:hypothetical protein
MVVDENTRIYSDLLSATTLDEATDPYWKSLLGFFRSLSTQDQETTLRLIRQTVVDTVSSMLNVIDGLSSIAGSRDIRLSVGGETISGDLQDLFLEAEEESRV